MAALGAVALQGVRRGTLEPGKRALVLGAGLIGQLVAQIAQTMGAEVTLAARTTARLDVALKAGLRVVRDLSSTSVTKDVPPDVVFDVTGNPDAVHTAIESVAAGGRIVLIGSSRGISRAVDWARCCEKAITIDGAHSRTLPRSGESNGAWDFEHERRLFLDLAVEGRLELAPLITHRVAPDRVGELYASLAHYEESPVGVVVDWTRAGCREGAAVSLGRVARSKCTQARDQQLSTADGPRKDGRRLRWGLVGCGEIALESARVLTESSTSEICGLFDIDPRRAQSLATAAEILVARDLDELLMQDAIDVVLVSTPHHLHAELAIRCANAGKHVVVEKPMATRLYDCDLMIDAARQNGVVLSIVYCQRFDPRMQYARQLLRDGAVGELMRTRVTLGVFRTESYFTTGRTGRWTGDWRAQKETAGGGVLIMNACHTIADLLWLTESPVRDVSARVATLSHHAGVEDTAVLCFRHECGALGTLEASTAQIGPALSELCLYGRSGQIIVGESVRFWSERTIAGHKRKQWHTEPRLPSFVDRRRYFEAVADSILEGKLPPVTGNEGRDVQAFIEAAYSAAV